MTGLTWIPTHLVSLLFFNGLIQAFRKMSPCIMIKQTIMQSMIEKNSTRGKKYPTCQGVSLSTPQTDCVVASFPAFLASIKRLQDFQVPPSKRKSPKRFGFPRNGIRSYNRTWCFYLFLCPVNTIDKGGQEIRAQGDVQSFTVLHSNCLCPDPSRRDSSDEQGTASWALNSHYQRHPKPCFTHALPQP